MSYFPSARSAGNNVQNLFKNAGFNLWNKATSFVNPSGDQMIADGWLTNIGSASVTISQESTASNVDSGQFSCKFDLTSTGTGTTKIYQQMESPERYRGKTMTFSIRMKTSVANIYRIRYSDDSATVTSDAHTGSGNWETISITRTVPTNATFIDISFGIFSPDAHVTGVCYMDSAMAYVGEAGTPFTPEEEGLEALRAERYFQFSTEGQTRIFPIFRTTSGTDNCQTQVYFRTRMYNAPVVTITENAVTLTGHPEHGNALLNSDEGNWSASADNISTEGFRFVGTATTNRSLGLGFFNFDWEAEQTP